MMNKELEQFYIEINDWVERSCKNHSVFTADHGLCMNYSRFLIISRKWPVDYAMSERNILARDFILHGLDIRYPFNAGSEMSYDIEKDTFRIYKNNKRLKWIRTKAQKVKDYYES